MVSTNKEYLRLRKLGVRAIHALRSAKTKEAWDALEDQGLVRLHLEPEQERYDDSYLDTWDIPQSRIERIRKSLQERIERDGVWILEGQYLNSEGDWEMADCIGGFVGDEWRDSGYDTDVMAATLKACKEEQAKVEEEGTEEQEIQAFQLTLSIACLLKDGEFDEDGHRFEMRDQDCYETLHSLIDQARDICWLEDEKR